ncbi:MAG: hypothetical protein PHQ25_04060 [Acidobacteriota bacterium]|nr:hypothetical protein [Acidobacteriota bacterium]MDW3228619.1 hypothetical protein [Acidobacteriota bacterium]MDY0231440.1 hypothetical protein [Candidatus Saccharicenans sp.]
MSLGNYLEAGLNRALSRFKIALYLWLIISVVALIAITPIGSLVRSNLGHLTLSQDLSMPFELNIVEVLISNQNIFAPYTVFLIAIVLISMLLFIFLKGGLFGRMLNQDNRINISNFLADGSRYFWKFLLSLIIFLPFLFIFFLLFRLLAAPLEAWSDGAVTEWPVIISANLKLLLFVLLLAAFKLLLDLVRIIIVTESKKVWPAYCLAIKFLSRHFFSFWGLYLLLGLVVALICLGWLLVGQQISSNHLAGILISIILAQAFLMFRLLARQLFIGVEFSYYSKRKDKV